jgi:hypothetical protein
LPKSETLLQHQIGGEVSLISEELAGKVTPIKHLQQSKPSLGSPVQNVCYTALCNIQYQTSF